MNRPDSFGFAMDFLGEPEASELLAYIQDLEKAQGEWISVDTGTQPDGVDVPVKSANGVEGVAKYWALIGRWLTADKRLNQGEQVTHFKTPPTE